MPFDEQGYRQAAKQAGIPRQLIDQTVAQNTGAKGWLTNGKQGVGGVVAGAGNILNATSYGIGGMLNQAQKATGNKYGQQSDATGLGIIDGIKNKRAVMTELPETFGVDPNSGMGKAIGFGGELLTPTVPFAGQIGKAAKGAGLLGDAAKTANVASDVAKPGLLARGVGKVGQYAENMGNMTPLRGLGRNQTTKNLIGKLERQGTTPEQFFDKYQLWNKDLPTAHAALDLVDEAYQAAARQSGKSVSTGDIVRVFDTEIAKLAKDAGQSETVARQLNRVQQARDAFVKSLEQNTGGALSTPLQAPLSAVADAKRAVSKDVNKSAFNVGADNVGNSAGADTARQIFKNQLDTATGTTAKLGADESALIDYIKLLEGQQTANMGNKNISFPKMIAPFGGFALGGVPGAALTWGAEQALNSPIGLKAQSKGFRTAGQALQSPQMVKGLNATQKYGGKAATTGFRVSQQPPEQDPSTLFSIRNRRK